MTNTFTVWAEDGEYQAAGDTITAALLAWTAAHPHQAVAAITDDAMKPGLVLAGSEDPATVDVPQNLGEGTCTTLMCCGPAPRSSKTTTSCPAAGRA